MTDMIATAPEHLKVVEFRYNWMLAAGYGQKNAEKIAKATNVDWHTAYDIRKKCADEQLCMKVLFGR
jgi:hypothetical protein